MKLKPHWPTNLNRVLFAVILFIFCVGGVSLVESQTRITAIEGMAGDGAAVAGNPMRIAGKDGSGNTQDILTDNSGVLAIQDNGGSITIDGTVSATQSGTWNVGTLSTITNVVHVDDNSSTLSVDDGGGSLTVDGTVAATQSGTWNVGTVSTITNVVHVDDNASTISIDDGAGSITVDGTVAVSGTVTVGSHAVTNAGTFSVQESGSALTALQLIDNVVTTEDTASANADSGIVTFARRTAIPANTSGADLDYEALQMNAGRLWVDASGVTLTVASHAVTNAGTFATQESGAALTALQLIDNLVLAEDAAHSSGDPGTLSLAVRQDTISNSTSADGDYGALKINSVGRLYTSATIDAAIPAGTNAIGKLAANSGVDIGDVDVTSLIPGTGATNLGKAIDSAAGGTDTGLAMLAIRDDATTTLTPVDGDYVPLRTNARGALWVDLETRLDSANDSVKAVGNFAEDAAHSSGDAGDFILAVRRDANTTFVSADGDYSPLAVDANGNLKVNVIAGSASATQFAEDAAHSSGDSGMEMLAVRQDTIANSTSADGDYGTLKINSVGRIYTSTTIDAALPAGTNAIGKLSANDGVDIGDVTINNASGGSAVNIQDGGNSITVDGTVTASIAAGATTIAKAEDVASADADVGVPAMAIRKATPANTSGTDGDWEALQMSAGRLWVDASGVTLTVGSHAVTNAGTFAVQDSQVKAEDAASANADNLFPVAGIRRDTPVANANVSADGDYTNFLFDNLGKLWTAETQSEDAAHTSADKGAFVLAVRSDTLAASSGTTGDYEAFHTNSIGAIWNQIAPATAGGLSFYKTLDLDETEEDVKTSAGQLYGYYIFNNAASTRYVKIYNSTAASVTVGTTTPDITIPIPAGSAANVFSDIGWSFSTGICIAATNGVADNDTGAPAANDVVCTFYYK